LPQPQHPVLASVRLTLMAATPQNGQQNRQAQAQQAQNGQAAHGYGVYSTQSSRGTWLFPPTGNAGANS
jgi:hypothetical protein